MTTSLRDRRRRQLRDDVLKAAQHLIAERGYAAMSMDDLAAEAGISKPTLYMHFSSKESVVGEVAVNRMQWLVDEIAAVPPELSPLGKLLHILRKLVLTHIAEQALPLQAWSPELFRVVCEHPEARVQMRKLHQGISGLAQAAIESGEIDGALSPDAVVLAFHSLGAAIKLTHVEGIPWQVDTERFADSILTIFERGVRPASA